MITFKTEIRVRYADTDQMGIVYNGKYLEYFEVGRTELLRNFGLAYKTVEDEGYMLPLIETGLKFKKPAIYDDLLEVEAKVEKLISPTVHIEYRIFRKVDKELLTEGFTTHVFTRKSDNKPSRPPGFYIDKLKEHFE